MAVLDASLYGSVVNIDEPGEIRKIGHSIGKIEKT